MALEKITDTISAVGHKAAGVVNKALEVVGMPWISLGVGMEKLSIFTANKLYNTGKVLPKEFTQGLIVGCEPNATAILTELNQFVIHRIYQRDLEEENLSNVLHDCREFFNTCVVVKIKTTEDAETLCSAFATFCDKLNNIEFYSTENVLLIANAYKSTISNSPVIQLNKDNFDLKRILKPLNDFTSKLNAQISLKNREG